MSQSEVCRDKNSIERRHSRHTFKDKCNRKAENVFQQDSLKGNAHNR